jgi:O-antigen/teichoic acid export membrane protein
LTLLVGKGYDAGSVPLAILAVASIATIIAIPISPILIVLNETLLAASVSLLALPLSLGVELASIPVLGILGASIARGLSMLLSLLLTWYLVRRKIPIKLDYQAITKSAAASLAMALVMWSLQLLYYSRFLLPLYLAIGALVYLFAIRELKMLNTADIELARQVLGARFSGMCDLLARVLLP